MLAKHMWGSGHATLLCVMFRDAKGTSDLGSDDPLVSKATEMSMPIRIRMNP